MDKKWKKRELYERYAGVCLSEQEYNLLKEYHIIRDLAALYYGATGSQRKDDITRYDYQGSIIDKIWSCGVKLFLESWVGVNKFDNDHTAAFFFDNFVVIIAEPRPNSNFGFDRAPDVIPVVIPNL